MTKSRMKVWLFVLLGAGGGFAFGWYQVMRDIAYMREHWGWVCGTGLESPLFVWTPIGALVGWYVGRLIRWLRERYQRSRAARPVA